MKRNNEYGVILIFALLHAAVSLIARFVGFHELLILTLLTMIMSVVLSLRKNMSILFMVLAVILINFIGKWIGEMIGDFVRAYIFPPVPIRHYIAGPFCNFVTTWILGLGQLGAGALLRKSRSYKEVDTRQAIWLIVAFATVLVIRLVMMINSSESFLEENVELNIIIDYICSMAAILWMAKCTLDAQQNVLTEKKKRHEAQYSYERLKQQIEPHFLFNSLNTLGSIVEADRKDQALAFTRKLSEIYRYLIDNEEERLVFLEEELHFVDLYVDLMQVRFPEGIRLETAIPSSVAASRQIIPCSLQLLVENAIKHNSFSAEEPLVIRIRAEEDYLVVTNDRRPKVSSQPSTGNGQRYIRKRCHDELGKEVIICEDTASYTVKLPIL